MNSLAGFAQPDTFIVINSFAVSQSLQNSGLFIVQSTRNNRFERLSYSFGFGVLEQALRARIPTGDDSVQILRDDGVIGGFHHSGEPGGRLFSSRLRGDLNGPDLTLVSRGFSIRWYRSLDWRRAGGGEVLGY